jgi:hypothetical protein
MFVRGKLPKNTAWGVEWRTSRYVMTSSTAPDTRNRLP